MSFAFNFDDPVDPADDLEKQQCYTVNDGVIKGKEDDDKKEIKLIRELEEFYDEKIFKKLSVKIFEFRDCVVRTVDTSCLEQIVCNDKELRDILDVSNILEAVDSHSDLISGTYEGGLKIWECALDLTQYLSTKLQDSSLRLEDKSVLELGCGAGLPGLLCMKKCAQSVHFQDYNEEVLKLLTCSNVRLCSEDNTLVSKCRYFAGDWTSFIDLASKENLKYDIILTAETIYNVDNYSKLHSLFDAVLGINGSIYVAAKSYYFGVGGSTEGFLEFVGSLGVFTSETVYTVSKGVPRYILLLKRAERNGNGSKSEDQNKEATNIKQPLPPIT